MVTGSTLGSDDNSALLCYWTPANINWHEIGCWICWAARRNGWIQACIGRVFGRTKLPGCPGKVNNDQKLVMLFFSQDNTSMDGAFVCFVAMHQNK